MPKTQSTFPTTIDATLQTDRQSGDVITSDSYDVLEDGLFKVETKVGIDSSAVATTLDYLLKNTSSVDPGHKHSSASLNDPLTATNVSATTVKATTVSATTLSSTDVKATTVTGTTLSATTFSGTNAYVTTVSATTLSSANVRATTVTGTTLSATTFSGTNAYVTTVTGTTVSAANIRATTVTGTTLSAATFSGTNVYVTTVSATTISAATLSGTNAYVTTVSATTLSAADVKATTVTGTTLSATTFSGTNLYGTTVSATTLSASSLCGTTFSATTSFTISAYPTNIYGKFGQFAQAQVPQTGRLQAAVTADSDIIFGVQGATMGMRVGTTSAGSFIEGVDTTLAGSYQLLAVGGSAVVFTIAGTEKARLGGDFCFGLGGTAAISDGVGIHIFGKILRLGTAKTPASSGAAGNVGEICWDTSYIYVCTAASAWKRAAIAGW